MAIFHQYRPKFKTRNEEIVANLFEAAGATPPAPPEIVVKRKAAEVSCLMALIHGGDWRVVIDHDHQFVSISRQPLQTRS